MRGARGYIQLLSGGGTIARGPSGVLRPASLIRTARWLPAEIPVRGDELGAEGAERVRAAAAETGCLGVVVTLEFAEMGALLRGLGDGPGAGMVVLTGALVAPGVAGTDGPGNVGDAIRVACDEGARGLGVLVVAGGRIHAGAEVVWTLGERGGRVHSEPCGPVGLVTPRGVEIVRRPLGAGGVARGG